MIWTVEDDREARGRVATICDASLAATARDAAWRELLIKIAPHVEDWAQRSRTLRRCNLTGEDDVRAVLVEVMRRLANHEFQVLRAFIEQRPPTAADELDDQEQRAIDRVVHLLADDHDAAEPAPEADTPLRAWLLKIVGYAAKDHVRFRLGRPGETPGTKRDVNTGALPLDAAAEAAERPPFTDLMTTRRVLEEIREVIATFPPAMQRALALWADDARFDAIASELALEGADRARDLVRAATARLRDRFRERFPSLVSA